MVLLVHSQGGVAPGTEEGVALLQAGVLGRQLQGFLLLLLLLGGCCLTFSLTVALLLLLLEQFRFEVSRRCWVPTCAWGEVACKASDSLAPVPPPCPE